MHDTGTASCRASDYIGMTVLLWISGNPIIQSTGLMKPVVSSLTVVLLVVALMKRVSVPSRSVWIILGFAGITLAQASLTGSYSIASELGFYSRLVLALMAVCLIRNFAKAFVDVMYWTAMISLPIFALMLATRGNLVRMVEPIAFNIPDPHILIYYFSSGHPRQNNSYFWEPGVFGGYLVVAITLLSAVREQFGLRRYRFILLVLLVALASTQSTGGYVAVLVALILHGKALGRSLLIRAVLAFVVTVGALLLFQKVDFLGSKISSQYNVVEAQQKGWQLTRLGSILSDWRQIQVHPVFGWGPDPESRLGSVNRRLLIREGNGLSNFTAAFGFCGLGLYLASVWVGFRNLFSGRKGLAALALLVVVLVLNDECFLSFTLFLTFMYFRKPSLQLAEDVPARAAGSLWKPAAEAWRL